MTRHSGDYSSSSGYSSYYSSYEYLSFLSILNQYFNLKSTFAAMAENVDLGIMLIWVF